MCGRYTLTRPGELLEDEFFAEADDIDGEATELLATPRFNIAPTQSVVILREVPTTEATGPVIRRQLIGARWGLIPPWASEPPQPPLINARAESVAEKPSFRDAFEHRRCLVPADGFYEWRRTGEKSRRGRAPIWFRRSDGGVFAMAGLWQRWRNGDETVESCCVITTTPNSLVADLHDRMPVILPEETWAAWLDPTLEDSEGLLSALSPYDSAAMSAQRVSAEVNKVANDGPELLEPDPAPPENLSLF